MKCTAALIDLNSMLIFTEELIYEKNRCTAKNCWKLETICRTDDRIYQEQTILCPIHGVASMAGTDVYLYKNFAIIPLEQDQANKYRELINRFRESRMKNNVDAVTNITKIDDITEAEAAAKLRAEREKLVKASDKTPPNGIRLG